MPDHDMNIIYLLAWAFPPTFVIVLLVVSIWFPPPPDDDAKTVELLKRILDIADRGFTKIILSDQATDADKARAVKERGEIAKWSARIDDGGKEQEHG